MKKSFSFIVRFREWARRARFFPNISWLPILPAGVWGIEALYLPILGGSLSPTRTWAITILIVMWIAISLIGHVVGHVAAARLLNAHTPARISVFLFGDTAQLWPCSTSSRKEMVVAIAGPFVNLVIAGLAYLVWNAQLNQYLNLSMPIVAIFRRIEI